MNILPGALVLCKARMWLALFVRGEYEAPIGTITCVCFLQIALRHDVERIEVQEVRHQSVTLDTRRR